MKILLATGIYPPDAGGPATYTQMMARELTSRLHDVEVVCYTDDAEMTNDKTQITKNIQYPVTRISRSLPLLFRYIAFTWKVFRRARAMNADLVYLQGPVCEGLPGTIGAIFAGKPTVMKVVGDYAWEMYQSRRGGSQTRPSELLDEFITHRHAGKIGLLERIERWTARRAKRVITPSVYLKDIVKRWGVPSEKIKVIYNNVEPPDAGLSRDEVRKTFDVEEKRVLFTAVRAVPWKSIDFIIRLLPQLAQDIVLVIAGDGPSLESWKREAITAGVQDRVRFLGKLDREQIGGWYRAADLFVLPSGYEGYPNVVPEAWSQGLPCFVSDKGGNPELHTLCMFSGDQKPDIFHSRPYRVLSYLQEQEWMSAFLDIWPRRFQGYSNAERLNKRAMVDNAIEVFKSII